MSDNTLSTPPKRSKFITGGILAVIVVLLIMLIGLLHANAAAKSYRSSAVGKNQQLAQRAATVNYSQTVLALNTNQPITKADVATTIDACKKVTGLMSDVKNSTSTRLQADPLLSVTSFLSSSYRQASTSNAMVQTNKATMLKHLQNIDHACTVDVKDAQFAATDIDNHQTRDTLVHACTISGKSTTCINDGRVEQYKSLYVTKLAYYKSETDLYAKNCPFKAYSEICPALDKYYADGVRDNTAYYNALKSGNNFGEQADAAAASAGKDYESFCAAYKKLDPMAFAAAEKSAGLTCPQGKVAGILIAGTYQSEEAAVRQAAQNIVKAL